MTNTKREDWILPRMKGPALLALFPEILVHSALDLAEVSPESLSDALLFILYLEKESDKRRMHGVKCCLFICSHVCLFPFNIVSPPTDFTVGSWTDISPSAFNSTCTPYCTTVKRKKTKRSPEFKTHCSYQRRQNIYIQYFSGKWPISADFFKDQTGLEYVVRNLGEDQIALIWKESKIRVQLSVTSEESQQNSSILCNLPNLWSVTVTKHTVQVKT